MIGTVEAARAPLGRAPGRRLPPHGLGLRGRGPRPGATAAPSCSRFQGDWYTQPKKESETYIEETRERRDCCGVELSFGIVSVTEQVVAFQRKHVTDHRVLDLQALELPEQDFVTQALWYELPDALLRDDFPLDALQGSLHAAEHAPDRGAAADRDVRPLGHRRPLHRVPPADRPPHDLHLRRASRRRGPHAGRLRAFEGLVDDALRLISECPCKSGCPSCVQSPEVRQPERAAEQARRGGDAEPHGVRRS